MSKKIFLTGATGLLGSSLYPYLKKQGFCTVAGGFEAVSDINCDLCNQAETEKMLSEQMPDIIINLAALTNVDECELNTQKAYLLNTKIVENIVGWIKKHPFVNLIHISTDQVYDGNGPHKEGDITLLNTYGFSKYCAELVAMQVRGTILRTNFFGHSAAKNKKSFSDWLIESFQKKEPIKLFTDVLFSPLSIDTLQEMIVEVVNNPIEGVYNLGSREGMSKRDFAMTLAENLSLDTNNAKDALSKELSLKARRPSDMRMDCGLFESIFNITMPYLRDEIKRVTAQ